MSLEWGNDTVDIDRVQCSECGCEYDQSEHKCCPECGEEK